MIIILREMRRFVCLRSGGYATLKIELPADWDALMAELGYRPLKEFYLKEGK